ncbi:nuclear transport factor 2 family protein [Halostella sp. JP-L12]|uniref:nuclear transport factor 2 family protein n=1 Tax=Halostella TaxID=1843185 RepID=UPI000EF82973|nr:MULTISPECIES: nuclear transport factor 2 family protein [Halostella]NHN46786.1 nuclear transport factor 2 family protein [Halostella sp. JP-L12]
MSDPEATVRAYYAALDEGAYDEFDELLVPEFVQRRPDRAFEGREAFVAFMRDDRPMTDTTHELDAVFVGDEREEVAVRGRLLDADGDMLFPFVDVHELTVDGRIERLETFTQ